MGNKNSKYGLKREAKNGVTRIVGNTFYEKMNFKVGLQIIKKWGFKKSKMINKSCRIRQQTCFLESRVTACLPKACRPLFWYEKIPL